MRRAASVDYSQSGAAAAAMTQLPSLGALPLGGASAAPDAPTDSAFDDRALAALLLDNRHVQHYSRDFYERPAQNANGLDTEAWYLNLATSDKSSQYLDKKLVASLAPELGELQMPWDDEENSLRYDRDLYYPRITMLGFLRGWAPGWAYSDRRCDDGACDDGDLDEVAPTYVIAFMTREYNSDKDDKALAAAFDMDITGLRTAISACMPHSKQESRDRFGYEGRPMYQVIDCVVRAALARAVRAVRPTLGGRDTLDGEQLKRIRTSSLHAGTKSEYGIVINWSIDTRLLLRDAPTFDAYVAGDFGNSANALARAVFEPLFCNLLWLARRDKSRDELRDDRPASVTVWRRYGSALNKANSGIAVTDQAKVDRFLKQVAGVDTRVSGVPMEYHTSVLSNSGSSRPPFNLGRTMPALLTAGGGALGLSGDAPPVDWQDTDRASS